MRKVKVKIAAKVNLALDVTGKSGGFHEICSVVASCALYDAVTLYKRDDGLITLKERGLSVGVPAEENNAYKAAKAFQARFGTQGVNIVVDKKIPVGGGLGGSSADIAAVLIGMRALYGAKDGISGLAEELGSDVNYMFTGGYALMLGKGDTVVPLGVKRRLDLVLITGGSVGAGNCYKKYDELNPPPTKTARAAAKYLVFGDLEGYASKAENALYAASLSFCPQMAENIAALKNSGAVAALMTGSGGTVFGVYKTKNEAKTAYKNLKPRYGDKVILTHTV